MTTMSNYVFESLDGVLVIGDVHADFQSFEKACNYSRSENFLLLATGDLVDSGRQPFEVVSKMHSMMYDGLAGITIGNHDDKHYRAIKGNSVRFSHAAKQTLVDVGEERMSEFQRMYAEIIEDKMLSGIYHKFGDFTVVHAASHPSLWEDGADVGKTARSRFLVGETNGEVYEDGYPVRLYNWIEEVPMGKTVIVGHDKQPIHNVPITEPMVVRNKNGGKVIFLDTGCGKGGFLSGAILMKTRKGFEFEKFVEFK